MAWSIEAAQVSGCVLMVRPAAFGPNSETAATNAFQDAGDVGGAGVREAAVREFDGLVGALRGAGVRVVVVDDTPEPVKPDAVFCNNWVSFHGDGRVVLHAMQAPSRRAEVRGEVIEALESALGVGWERVDQSGLVEGGAFCEGTGSLVLDRVGRVAYAAVSPRTTRAGVAAFCEAMGYEAVMFTAVDAGGETYHTNVMMSIGGGFAVVCADSIIDECERAAVVDRLAWSGREVLEITAGQRDDFVGNMLMLRGGEGAVIVMSSRAEGCLGRVLRGKLEGYGRLVSAPLGTIERFGGGSARCMLCEVFGVAAGMGS